MGTANNNEALIQLVKTTAMALCDYIKSESNPQPKDNKKVYVISKHWTDGSSTEYNIIGVLDDINVAKECVKKLFYNTYNEYIKKYKDYVNSIKYEFQYENILERDYVLYREHGMKDKTAIILTECEVSNEIKI